MLTDICSGARVENHYTPHCLRATAIQCLNDKNFETRHIMFMSNHKNEASLRSYNRTVSSSQKKASSGALSCLTHPKLETAMVPVTSNVVAEARLTPSATVTSLIGRIPDTGAVVATINCNQVSMQSKNMFTSGFLANSTFSHCTFNFHS